MRVHTTKTVSVWRIGPRQTGQSRRNENGMSSVPMADSISMVLRGSLALNLSMAKQSLQRQAWQQGLMTRFEGFERQIEQRPVVFVGSS